MQNQPGQTPRKHARAHAAHKQAAGTSEDVFKGGQTESGDAARPWLRSPWKPAAGRLFESPPKRTDN
jgi:hypothetical protein